MFDDAPAAVLAPEDGVPDPGFLVHRPSIPEHDVRSDDRVLENGALAPDDHRRADGDAIEIDLDTVAHPSPRVFGIGEHERELPVQSGLVDLQVITLVADVEPERGGLEPEEAITGPTEEFRIRHVHHGAGK